MVARLAALVSEWYRHRSIAAAARAAGSPEVSTDLNSLYTLTMKTITLSEAKATLSEQIRHVRAGEVVIITNRGRPVARLSPVDEPSSLSSLDHLVAAGLVRRGAAALPPGFWDLEMPVDAEATVRDAVREERESGW